MKSLKINFKRDNLTGELIPKEYKEQLRKILGRNNLYYSEIADFYYKKIYNKNILEILENFYYIPRCPITGNLVTYKLSGVITFGKFSHEAWITGKISDYNLRHNKKCIESVIAMREKRKGKGNPMYGREAWNKGITKYEDCRINNISKNRMGMRFSEEHRKKLSNSAKKRKIHGHTGCKHNVESRVKISLAKGGNGDIKRLNSRKRFIWKDTLWRNKILLRDNYTCLRCSSNTNLEAHHIKPKAKFPLLRYDINNGITLCMDCHAKTYKKEIKLVARCRALLLASIG